MPILTPLDLEAEIVFLGVNTDRDAGLESGPLDQAELTLDGMAGEAHGGPTRPACSRMRQQYKKGVELRNARQVTLLSQEELEQVSAAMTLPATLRPEWIGANIVLKGLPRLSEIPPGTRLIFEGGAGLVVDLENAPCKFAAERIEAHLPGLGLSFPRHARGRRGVTAWVERAGPLTLGMRCRPHIPPQRIWPPDAERGG